MIAQTLREYACTTCRYHVAALYVASYNVANDRRDVAKCRSDVVLSHRETRTGCSRQSRSRKPFSKVTLLSHSTVDVRHAAWWPRSVSELFRHRLKTRSSDPPERKLGRRQRVCTTRNTANVAAARYLLLAAIELDL